MVARGGKDGLNRPRLVATTPLHRVLPIGDDAAEIYCPMGDATLQRALRDAGWAIPPRRNRGP